jgi:Ca2+-binding EF-hand superfamily protein
MSRFTVCCAVLAIAGSAVSLNALAQADVSFDTLDTNKDGQISIHEATANDALFTAFKRLDTNHDGSLTQQEFAAYKK